ncbi:MAG: sensor histidine kinase, partial [Eubacterium sp.]|nr:sensor histidine kinase [Eubacterium sp.]
YKRTQEATRAFRHDIINNLSLTNMMLDEGKTEEASEHLKALLGNVRALSPSVITGDEMLDCIVAMKADKMKELAIDFTADGVVDGGLHMKPMDVCSIFANAFDNAIEASNKMVPDAWVDLKIKRTEKFFILKISNSSVGKVDVQKLFMTAGYTSKKDTEHHGFGLRNIRNAVEEYDGLVKAESDDNSFALSIMIPRSEE